MNNGVQVSFSVMVFLEQMPSCRIAESHGSFIPFFFFKGIAILFSIWLYQCTLPPTVQKFSFFSISSSAFIVCTFFDDGHLTGVRRSLIVIVICIYLLMNEVIILTKAVILMLTPVR